MPALEKVQGGIEEVYPQILIKIELGMSAQIPGPQNQLGIMEKSHGFGGGNVKFGTPTSGDLLH